MEPFNRNVERSTFKIESTKQKLQWNEKQRWTRYVVLRPFRIIITVSIPIDYNFSYLNLSLDSPVENKSKDGSFWFILLIHTYKLISKFFFGPVVLTQGRTLLPLSMNWDRYFPDWTFKILKTHPFTFFFFSCWFDEKQL